MLFNRSPQGRINIPRNLDTVSRFFQAEGTIDHMPSDQHLLLVVQVGGLMWPKGEVQVKQTTWIADVHEGGSPPGGHFILSLFLVNSKGLREMAAWLEHGELTGDYPGIWRISDGNILHSVKLCLE